MKKKGKKVLLIILAVLALIVVFCAAALKIYADSFKVERVEEYLFEAECGEYSYGAAETFCSVLKPRPGAACTGIRKGDLVGRNFDWVYDESAEFVVRTPAENGRHATMGVASMLTGLEDRAVDSGRISAQYILLPFLLVDGINDAGLACSVNVAPALDTVPTSGTNPGAEPLCTAYAVRYILDYASDVDEAIGLLENRDLYAITYNDYHFELHWLISDREKSAVVETVDNELRIVVFDNPSPEEGDKPVVMTNFFLSEDGLTPHAIGTERYDIVCDGYGRINGEDSMLDLLKDVWMTRLYSGELDPFWYSEYYEDLSGYGFGCYSSESDKSEIDEIVRLETELFETGERSGIVYQTVHTSVYNLKDLTLKVVAQENGEEFVFKLEG